MSDWQRLVIMLNAYAHADVDVSFTNWQDELQVSTPWLPDVSIKSFSRDKLQQMI